MASLGTMLAGSSIGQGAAQFVHQQAQGAFDRQRFDQTQAANNFSQNQMDRTLQEQQIASTPTDGETDEDRLHKAADLAKAGGRADLERKYRAEAVKVGQSMELMSIANASKAITLGQFDQAAQMLNRTKTFKGVHGITLADDAEQDPRNPTYSVYTQGPPDANGNPTKGPHMHVTQQMLYALQADPSHLYQWTNQAINQGQRNDAYQQRVDQQGTQGDRRLDQKDTQIAETERNNRVKAAWHSANAGRPGGASGRVPNEQWRAQWALGEVGKPGGFKDEREARQWASDPNWEGKAGRAALTAAVTIGPYGGDAKTEKILATRDKLLKSPLGAAVVPAPAPAAPPVAPPTQPPAPAPAAHVPQSPSNPLEAQGLKPAPGRGAEGVYLNPKGIAFKVVGGQTLAWSNAKQTWIPVQ